VVRCGTKWEELPALADRRPYDARARLANATVTEVGMNVLAPVVASGRLRPALRTGLSQDSRQASLGLRPDSRKRDARPRRQRVSVAEPGRSADSRRDEAETAVARARLLIVHSREIDDAGE
jgi:hypothetical protein